MKEIKFRAWDERTNEMIEVDILRNKPCRQGYTGTFWSSSAVGKLSDSMQYTGRKDSKGKEIYEGDVCELIPTARWKRKKYKNMYGIRQVVWSEEYAQYYYSNFIPMSWGWKSVEVIGNIFENPELIDKIQNY